MKARPVVDVIIPAYNEVDSVPLVIADLPDWVRDVIVANNNSTDGTPESAAKAGATVVHETRQGYGSACLKGMEFVANKDILPDIIVFVDADYSDGPLRGISLIL